MAIQRRKRAIYLLAVWLCGVLVGMAALDAFALDRYLAASLVGLLVIERRAASATVTPRWKRRLNRVLLLGLVVFGGLVAWRAVRLVTQGVA